MSLITGSQGQAYHLPHTKFTLVQSCNIYDLHHHFQKHIPRNMLEGITPWCRKFVSTTQISFFSLKVYCYLNGLGNPNIPTQLTAATSWHFENTSMLSNITWNTTAFVLLFFLIQALSILFNAFSSLIRLQVCISLCFSKLTGSSLGNSVVTLDV